MENNEVAIDGCNILEERKFLIHTDKYSIGEDGLIDEGGIPFTDICYDLALQLQRAKAELEQYKKSKQASYESMQTEWNNAVNTLRDVEAENKRLKAENEELRKECNKYNSFCVEANAQNYELTQIIFSIYRLLIRDFDNLKGKILEEKDIEYIEKRNQSISQCLKQLNEVLNNV